MLCRMLVRFLILRRKGNSRDEWLMFELIGLSKDPRQFLITAHVGNVLPHSPSLGRLQIQ